MVAKTEEMLSTRNGRFVGLLIVTRLSIIYSTRICGVVYQVIIELHIVQISFPNQANGSIITVSQDTKQP
jgi:K+-transporting ATPase c subunit